MQDGVREEGMWNEVQALSGMGRWEKLVLRMDEHVSLRWHSIVVMNYQCLGARHVIVTCGFKCHLVFCVCMYVSSKWRNYCWQMWANVSLMWHYISVAIFQALVQLMCL